MWRLSGEEQYPFKWVRACGSHCHWNLSSRCDSLSCWHGKPDIHGLHARGSWGNWCSAWDNIINAPSKAKSVCPFHTVKLWLVQYRVQVNTAALHWTSLHFTSLHCNSIHYTAQHSTALLFTKWCTLHCTMDTTPLLTIPPLHLILNGIPPLTIATSLEAS